MIQRDRPGKLQAVGPAAVVDLDLTRQQFCGDEEVLIYRRGIQAVDGQDVVAVSKGSK